MDLTERWRWLTRFISQLTLAPQKQEIHQLLESKYTYIRSTQLIMRQAIHLFVFRKLVSRSATVTYHLILSLVPILSIAFTFFKTFGGLEHLLEQTLIPKITSYFDPTVSAAMEGYFKHILSNMQTGTLGATALFTLLLTVASLMGSIEAAFNEINDTHRERPWLQRLLNYWLLITLTPFMVVVSISKSSEFIEAFSSYLPQGIVKGHDASSGFAAALLVEALGFTILYYVLPARRLRVRSAVAGGVFAALGFESLQWINAYATGRFVHEASLLQLYGSVPVIAVMLFIWLRLVALVLLSGMAFASAVNRVSDGKRNPINQRRAPAQSLIEHVLSFAWILQSFRGQRHGVTASTLGRHLGLSQKESLAILTWFEETGCVWSNRIGGRRVYSPTATGLALQSDPTTFVRDILHIEPMAPEPCQEEPTGGKSERLRSSDHSAVSWESVTRTIPGVSTLDPDLFSDFVQPALESFAPLPTCKPAKV